MADFDPNNYFANKLKSVGSTEKLDALAKASRQKTADLAAYLQQAEAYQAQAREMNKDSWVNQLGLDPYEGMGQAVNAGAAVVEGVGQFIGHTGAAITGLPAAMAQARLSEEEIAALNRNEQGIATDADKALISRKKSVTGDPNVPQDNVDQSPFAKTPLELWETMKSSREYSTRVKEGVDFGSVVNRSRQMRFAQEIGDAEFESSMAQAKEGWEKKDVGTMASGLTGLAANAFKAVGDNPGAAVELMLQNAPQLIIGASGKIGGALLAASNAGYVTDEYNKAIQNYQKANGGALPPEDKRAEMLAWATSLGLMEQASDKLMMGVSKAGKLLKPKSGDELIKEAAKRGFMRSVLGTTGAAVGAGIGEFGTESYQAFAEGELNDKPASAKDIYTAGVMGMAASGGLSGTVRGLAELTGSTPDKAIERQEDATRQEAVNKAIATGDVSALLDPQNKAYAPDRAVAALMGNSKDADETTKKANLAKASDIVESLSQQKAESQEALKDVQPENVVKLQNALALVREKLGQADSADAEQVKSLQSQAKLLEGLISTPEERQKIIAAETRRIAKLDRLLEGAEKNLDMFRASIEAPRNKSSSETEDAAPAATTAEQAEKTISLAMSSRKMSGEQAEKLANDTANALNEAQRGYLRVLSKVRQLESRLTGKDMGKVGQEILFGSPKGAKNPQVGITTYQDRMASAVAAGNKALAQRHVDGISKFAADQQSKAAAMEQAWAEFQDTGRSVQVIRDNEGWKINRGDRLGIKEMDERAFPTVHRSTPEELIQNIRLGADAVAAAKEQLSRAFDLKFKPQANVQNAPRDQNAGSQASQAQGTKAPANAASPTAASQGAGVSGQGTAPVVEPTGVAPAGAVVQSTPQANQAPSNTSPLITNKGKEMREGEARLETGSETTSSGTESSKDQQSSVEDESSESSEGLTALRQQQPEITKLGEVYTSIKRAAAFLVQKSKPAQRDKDIPRDRPLAVMQNFLSRWDKEETSAQDFFLYELSDQEQLALNTFKDMATKWAKDINERFIAGSYTGKKRADFLYEDPAQDLLNADGSMDENVVTAVAYGAYSWLTDTLSGPAILDQEAILKMHGQWPDGSVDRSTDLYKQLQLATTLEDNAINEIGNRIIQALGLQARPDAPADYLPKLAAALGTHGMLVLEERGMLKRGEINSQELAEAIPSLTPEVVGKTRKGDPIYTTYSYVSLVRDENHKPVGDAKRMKDASVGTSAVLDRLITAEKAMGEASWRPIPFDQETAKRTVMGIPDELMETLTEAQKVPNQIIEDMWNAAEVLGREVVLRAAGWKKYDEEKIHIDNRRAVEAENENLENQFDGMAGLVQGAIDGSVYGIKQRFYANFEVWRNFRVGVTTRNMNLQSSKIHRFMFFRPEWQTTIDLNDAAAKEDFEVALAQAFGEKIDKKSKTEVANEFNATLLKADNPTLELAIKLYKSIQDPKNSLLTEGDKDSIAELTSGKEGMQTLQGLVVLGKYKLAQLNGASEVTVQMLVGVDGKTNGPMFSMLALGAAANADELLPTVNKGGFYEEGSGHTNFNRWYQDTKGQDLYESLAKHLLKNLGQVPADVLSAFQVITKELLDSNDNITGAGRGIVKTPLTAFAFGSSVERSVESMREAFLQAVIDRIQAVATGEEKNLTPAQLIGALNTLITLGGGSVADTLPSNMPMERLMEMRMGKRESYLLGNAFHMILGRTVEKGMKEYFAVFDSRRRGVNSQVQAAYGVYNTIYQDLRAKELARMMDEGQMAFVMEGDVRVPIHDLSPQQEKALRDRVEAILPRAHTAYSKATGDLGSGLYMAKSENRLSRNPAHQIKVQLGKPAADGKVQIKTRPSMRYEISPGVAGLPYWMHSLDSAVMHRSIKGTQSLNVHDEAGNGAGNVIRTAQAINKATWETMVAFSPATEAYEMLERSIQGLLQMIESGEISSQVLTTIVDGFSMRLPKEVRKETPRHKVLDVILKQAKRSQFIADGIRLDTLRRLTSVDQYTWEGGQYDVSDKDRQKVADMLTEHKKQGAALAQETQATLDKLAVVVKDMSKLKAKPAPKNIVATPEPEVDTEAQKQADSQPELGDGGMASKPTLGAALIGQVAEAMGPQFTKQLAPIVAAVKGGKLLRDVLNALPNDDFKAAVIEAVSHLANRLPPGLMTVWGEVGRASVEADPALVAFFQNKPNAGAREVMSFLYKQIKSGPDNRVTRFQLNLLQQLAKVVDKDLVVQYITPTTPAAQAIEATSGARGWYTVKGSEQEINLLSPDFVHSGLTVETVLHELTHAALTRVIEEVLSKKPGTEAAQGLVSDLQTLLEKARNAADKKGLSQKYSAALGVPQVEGSANPLHEFVTWGMTNQEFQREILNQITMQSKTKKNSLVQGMKAFISTLTQLLFKGSDKSHQAIAVNGMTVLISNVSGLMAQASAVKTPVDITLKHASMGPLGAVNDYSTLDIHAALADAGNPLSPRFDAHVRSILGSIVAKLHGNGFGSLRAAAMKNQAITPLDVWLKAMATGRAPFASKVAASPLVVNAQEMHAIEQVEVVVKEALAPNQSASTVAYKQLAELFVEARSQIRPDAFADFDARTGTSEQWNFIFRIEKDNGDQSDYLARFTALGLGHEAFNTMLKRPSKATRRTFKDGKSFAEGLQIVFENILELFNNKAANTRPGQAMDEKLEALVDKLVDIEAKRKHRLARQAASTGFDVVGSAEETIKDVAEGARQAVGKAAGSKWVRNNNSGYIRGAGAMTRVLVNQGVTQFMDDLTHLYDQQFKGRQGIAMSTVNYMRGPKVFLQELLRTAKGYEKQRKQVITDASKAVLSHFLDGGSLSRDQKSAVTQVFLRSGAHVLLDKFSMAQIHGLLTDPSVRQAEIDKLEKSLAAYPRLQHYFAIQANGLGYYKATGRVVLEFLGMNSYNIARMLGTGMQSWITEAQAQQAEKTIEMLTALRSISYSRDIQVKEAAQLMEKELGRNGPNGVEFVLKLHKSLEEQAKARLFKGNPTLMMHGYTAEIYNPHVSVEVASAIEGQDLIDRGYTKGRKVEVDPSDPDQTPLHMYVLKDGGLQPWLSGTLSLSSMETKGSKMHSGVLNPNTAAGLDNASNMASVQTKKMAAIQRMLNPSPRTDLSNETQTYMAPVFNEMGEVVNYRYLMNDVTKDSVLDRNNTFDKVMGTIAGSIFDKAVVKEQNHTVIQALYDQFTTESAQRPDSYVMVGPRSPDSSMRELWRLLPQQTKDSVRDIWGTEDMYVRGDQLDMVFGYRKLSLATAFQKATEERKDRAANNQSVSTLGLKDINLAQKLSVMAVETALEFSARLQGKTQAEADAHVKQAVTKVAKSERIWQEVVKEAKDLIVVKTGLVLAGNIWSNASLLVLNGVSLGEILKYHQIALRSASAYQHDMEALAQARLQMEAGYFAPGEDVELEQEIVRLEDAIARNPVKELIDAGLMPSIVEDVAQEEDIYSYKSLLVRKTEKYTAKLNSKVVAFGKLAYMSHDTKMYQFLSRTTQLSDFVARYTLYQHLINRKKDPLSKKDAIQQASESFVNYDIPMPRGLQFSDDMGLTYFTKYFLSIQRVLLKLGHDNPARVLLTMLLNGYHDLGPIVLDGSAVGRVPSNPIENGAFKLFTSIDDLVTVNAASGLLK
jgi:hypothetical protein